MKLSVLSAATAALLTLPAELIAQSAAKALPLKHAPHPTSAAISAADLMTRLYVFADDSMMGRQVGTEGNLKGTAYIEREVRRLGLVPAGDSGTYFQQLPYVRGAVADNSRLSVDGAAFTLWSDFAPAAVRGTPKPFDGAPVIFGGTIGDSASMISAAQAAGKFVIMMPAAAPTGGRGGRGGGALGALAGAAAVAIVNLDGVNDQQARQMRQPVAYMRSTTVAPVSFRITSHTAAALLGAPVEGVKVGATGKTVHGTVTTTETPAPARNVVAIVPGSDPKLKGQYVAVGAHNDHIGMRPVAVDHDSLRAFNTMRQALTATLPAGQRLSPEQTASIRVDMDSLRKLGPARRDSINNGADDDGSGSVGVLEIAEALINAKQKPKRSTLFVWHTGEEAGLLGSRWFTDHPTVPRDSIVAQLNMDMIGRGSAEDLKGGGPTYLQLVGSRRLSTELGDLVETVSKSEKMPFAFDYALDANGHPENIYCRSDHANYARYGIPVVFMTTGLHRDYHQLTDEPQYIDYDHMARVSQFMYDLTLRVANLDHRVVVDKPKPDPTAACRQ